MRLDFPYRGYEGFEPVDVPDDRVLGVWEPKAAAAADEDALVRDSLADPIGSPGLGKLLGRGDRVLILVDDMTRGTPAPRLLRHVAAELEAAGIRDEAVTLLTAQGTHREMSDAELAAKLGEHRRRFRVHQHRWRDASAVRTYGHTSDGTPVTANRLLAEADLVLGLGSIAPHRIMGFSGGAKIAFPGVSGPEVQERCQWEAALHPADTIMGQPENPMRRRIEEAASLVRLRFIVNVVTDAAGRIAGCFAGHPVDAHRRGCVLSREVNAALLPRRADVVVIDSHPADLDLWQSAKAVYAGGMAVRDGGVLVVVSPNPEGVAAHHPWLLETGRRSHAEVVAMVEAGQAPDVVAAAVLADMAQVLDRAECLLLSPGIPAEHARRLGFVPVSTARDALDHAVSRSGPHGRVAVLRQGGRILPLVGA
jgi:nickel-dependent lactate racemase